TDSQRSKKNALTNIGASDLVWSGAVPDERVEHLPDRFWVAAHDRGRGLDVAGGIKVLPGEREPGAAGELREEGPLRPPVALAERVQGVDLAQVIGQPPDERIAVQAAQAVFVVQLAEDDGRGGIYVLREAEHGALGDGHRPDLAGPLIYVAEDPLMDRPQVRQVVAGQDGRFVQQDQGRMSDLPLRGLKPGGGAEPELVVQDPGDRVTVRVPRHSRLPVAGDRPAV